MKFYDTCSLLLLAEKMGDMEEKFYLSSVTVKELEEIKTSAFKDNSIKYAARKVLHLLEKNEDKYKVVIYDEKLRKIDLPDTNDSKIIHSALQVVETLNEDLIFVTNDLSAKIIARDLAKLKVDSVDIDEKDYTGYVEKIVTDEELDKFYSNENKNHFNLLPNQYIIMKDRMGNIVDIRYWSGFTNEKITYNSFNSEMLGNLKPMKNDPYQLLAFDSLYRNKITALKGKAGSGKTTISLGFLFHLLDANVIEKIIVFCNPVATLHSARLGFYPGTKDEKLLDSQIGNLLSSKMGAREGVLRFIESGKLVLLPMSDIRGYDTTNMRAGIYITEAQNMDIELMKLALQRIGEDCICIIDGDCKTQVDDVNFSGANNGMRRMSEVFRGSDIYGEIDLKYIHRSEIAKIADMM